MPGTGWGLNGWGEGAFGSATALSSTNQLRLWTHDNFGEDLIINQRGGGIYRWVENNGLQPELLIFLLQLELIKCQQ